MATLHLLGTGAAVSDASRTTTMLAFENEGNTILIDCGGDVIQRALAVGIDLDTIEAMILTHEHPDHVSGFPLFMEKIWLAGRRRPIPVYGILSAINQARAIFEAFDTSSWAGMPEIIWNELELTEDVAVLTNNSWDIIGTPVDHAVPTIGLRVTEKKEGRAVAYSCDTEPTRTVVELAKNADILVHEATGEGPGHTSSEQAARIAHDASAKRLLLVHLPAGIADGDLTDARKIFPSTELGKELGSYTM